MADDEQERQEVTFTEFVKPERWKDFDSHARSINSDLSKDLATSSRQNERIRKEVRDFLEKEYDIRRVGDKELLWAEGKLFGCQVSAVDGTHSTYPMLSGIRCRIGVAATSYKNKRTDGVVFVSEQHLHPTETSVLGILKNRKPENRLISNMLIRAIMFYMERKIGLERQEEWVMFNGPVIPYELRTGIGRLRALDPCLLLCEQALERKTIVGVIGTSSEPEIISLGLALNSGEYVRLRSFKEDLEDYLPAAHFNVADQARFQRFIETYGDKLDVGIYKAGQRSYMFHAHSECFDEAAAVIMRDSMFQQLRGYPLLIDYADSLCTHMLASSDFRRMVDFGLAREGSLSFEQSEGDQRRR
ncbi:MAG: hypothetical protein PHY18_04725 [Dehalococcoidales bacterium]|nr:hypothetical protein [Dehalococcoidales bacterium]